jgi:hypothetical protein
MPNENEEVLLFDAVTALEDCTDYNINLVEVISQMRPDVIYALKQAIADWETDAINKR